MITKAGMEQIHKANQMLIDAKYLLIDTLELAETIEEKIDIAKVQDCVQAAIKVILRTFYPKTEFDEKAWLKRRTVKDAEHDARVQKILDDSAQRQAENETCGHDCKDCDQRHVAGDEEHCLQGEEMK